MPSPLEFLRQYRNLRVRAPLDDSERGVCREVVHPIRLERYFMMDWAEGTEERIDYNLVTRGSRTDAWFQENKESIRNAAMGKGSPRDYELALEWAVRSGNIAQPNQASIQLFCNERLGIDCSGFVTNYLVASGRRPYSASTARNTGAASYYNPGMAVNDPNTVRQGDLLVWLQGHQVKRSPGHVAVVQSYQAVCRPGGNMQVCEATGAANAQPKLLDSMYTVERIIDRGGSEATMVLVVRRHGQGGHRVAVMRA